MNNLISGQRLKTVRETLGLSQKQFARIFTRQKGQDRGQPYDDPRELSYWETGTRPIKEGALEELLAALENPQTIVERNGRDIDDKLAIIALPWYDRRTARRARHWTLKEETGEELAVIKAERWRAPRYGNAGLKSVIENILDEGLSNEDWLEQLSRVSYPWQPGSNANPRAFKAFQILSFWADPLALRGEDFQAALQKDVAVHGARATFSLLEPSSLERLTGTPFPEEQQASIKAGLSHIQRLTEVLRILQPGEDVTIRAAVQNYPWLATPEGIQGFLAGREFERQQHGT